MGAGTSISSATHEKAIKSTINVRGLANDILRFMLERIGINDFYKLASRTECSKYVIFFANKLDQTFRGLSFAPARGAAGKLYFQPIDILKTPSPKEKAERESLCLFLAYFYVRIFQIYGAITLTLTDDANTYVKMSEGQFLDVKYRDSDRRSDAYGPPGAPDPYPKPGLAGLFAPASKETFGPLNPTRRTGYTDTRRNDRGYDRDYDRDRDRGYGYDRDRDRDRYERDRRYGGSLDKADLPKLGEFQLFKDVLDDEKPQKIRIMEGEEDEKAIYKVDDNAFLFNKKVTGFTGVFTVVKVNAFTTEEKPSRGKLIFPTESDRAKTKIYVINVSIKKSRGGGGRPEGSYLKIMRVEHRSLLDQVNRMYARERYSTDRLLDLREGDLDRVFEAEFGVRESEFLILSANSDFEIRTNRGDISIKDFLKVIKAIVEDRLGIRSRKRNETRRNTGLGTLSLDNNIQAALGLDAMKVIRENPPANRPLNLCSARALQLLGNKLGDGKFETAVCNQGFLWQQKDGKTESRKSLIPDYEKTLEESVGFPLLAALFSDESRFREFKIMKSQNSIKEYIEFLIRMKKQYSPDETNRIKDYSEFLKESKPLAQKQLEIESSRFKLKEISDTKMKETCSGSNNREALKKPIELKSVKGVAVQQKVGQLYGRQIAHANRCEQILKQLFTVQMVDGVKSITINKNIFIRGINEVNRINQLTRQTLVKYYEDCERLYREGVEILVKDEKKPPPKAAEKADENEENNDPKPVEGKPGAKPGTPPPRAVSDARAPPPLRSPTTNPAPPR